MSNLLRSRTVVRLLCGWVAVVPLFASAAAAHRELVAPAEAAPPAPDRSARLRTQVPAGVPAVVAVFDTEVPTTTMMTTRPPAPTSAPPAPPAAPAPPPPAAPAPPAPPPSPAAPPLSREERVAMAYRTSVPLAWRDAIPVRLVIISGGTSWAVPDGEIQVARAHADGATDHLRAVLAHEFGHLVAFRYGAQRPNGAAPDGWPSYSSRPEEAWADCVSQVLTGLVDPTPGLPPCGGSSLSWTRDWMAAGPSAHEVTHP